MLKKKMLVVIACLCVLSIASFISLSQSASRCVVIGAKCNVEQEIVSEMMGILIHERLGIKTRVMHNLEGTWVCFNALKSGAIDMYVEYTGTALVAILKKEPSCSVSELRSEMALYGLAWLESLGFQNSYGLFVKNDDSLAHLSQISGERVAIDAEFYSRKEYDTLEKVYHFENAPTLADQGLLYISGERIIGAAVTDARLQKYGRRVLVDDKSVLPTYEPAPLVREETLQKFPQLEGVLALTRNLISQDEIVELNLKVELKGEKAYDVAFAYLKNKGLI